MKRIKVQFTAALLIAVIFLSAVLVPAKPAYAIAGVDDAAFILAMLAAAGVGYIGYSSYNSGNSNLAEDLWGELDDLEDDISDAFDKAVFKVLEGGGGGSDPNDFDPDNDDPEKKPTTWEKLKEWWKKHPNKALSIGVNGSVLGAVAGQFKNNIDEAKVKSIDFGNIKVSTYHKNLINANIDEFPYFLIYYDHDTLESKALGLSAHPISFYWDDPVKKNEIYGLLNNFEYYTRSSIWKRDYRDDYYYGMSSDIFYDYDTNGFNSSGFFPVPKYVYDTRQDAILHQYDTISYSSNLNPDSTLTTDAAKKAQEDEEKKDKPVYDNVVLPTPDQMTNYANQLQAIAQSDAEPAVKKEQQQQAMNTFVESITNVKEMPNPDPSPDPDPSPNPDPSPEPDPDAPATDEEAAKYTADLTTVFPFCIPFDLIRAFKVLSAEGEAPVYKMPLKIDYKSIHISEAWQIDMSDFASVIQILRVMETLGFIVGLILVTRKLIRG